MIKTVTELATLLAEKAPQFLRIAFNEEERTKKPQPEAAHFLKFNLNGDERRMGRDLELYAFMMKADGSEFMMALLLEELVLPLHGYSAPAYSAGLAWLYDHACLVKSDMQEEWKSLIKEFQEKP